MDNVTIATLDLPAPWRFDTHGTVTFVEHGRDDQDVTVAVSAWRNPRHRVAIFEVVDTDPRKADLLGQVGVAVEGICGFGETSKNIPVGLKHAQRFCSARGWLPVGYGVTRVSRG